MLRAAPSATTAATTAARTRGVQGAATTADASPNAIPNDGRYRVRSAMSSSIGTTMLATGDTVMTNHANPTAIPGTVRLVRHPTKPNVAHTSAPRRCAAVSPVATVSSPGE